MKLPEAECRRGYPTYQLEDYFKTIGSSWTQFSDWMRGQTGAICEGRAYSHETREYEEVCGGVAHGMVIYVHDVKRYLMGLPVID